MIINIILIVLFFTPIFCNSEIMVSANKNNTYSLFHTSNIDSCNFSENGDSLYIVASIGTTTVIPVSDIDSIFFVDGAAIYSANSLFNAAYAAPVIMNSNNESVTIDLRNRTKEDSAVIITDPIDLIDNTNNFITNNDSISTVLVKLDATTPSDSKIDIYWSIGDRFFSESGWSGWTKSNGTHFAISPTTSGGKYVKFRIVMSPSNDSLLPSIKQLAIFASYSRNRKFTKPLTISSYQNEKIVTGQYPFEWESRENEKISSLISNFRLDTCGNDSSTEFGKVVALLDWVSRRPQGPLSISPYPWNLDLIMTADGTIKGHCMSYSIVMVSALTGLGFYARHWAVEGIDNNNNHEVVEYWSNEYKKWIYLDPSLDTYYKAVSTGTPTSILENHNYYIKRQSQAIDCVDGKYHYGVYTPTYNWRTKHGYTTCGQMKLTERNNFHAQPNPVYNGFGRGFCGFSHLNWWHNWTDASTPLYTDLANPQYPCGTGKITCHTGRVRDFWYTLNQASIKAKRSGDKEILVEFGQSQPFFSHFIVKTDNTEIESNSATFLWQIVDGENNLEVTPMNSHGELGLSSMLTIRY